MSLLRSSDEGEGLASGSQEWLKRALLIGSAALGILLTGSALLLWLRHGPAVFFDTLAAGIAACF